MVPVALPDGAHEFASRKQIEEDIIKAMSDGEVKVIGVCGMGGVGKTTIAKQIMNRAREKECLFEEVVMVVVGQQTDLLKIQRDIAVWLGMTFEEETLIIPRAIQLEKRLTMDRKRRLVVIDDVWKNIDLKELGIPYESGLCNVLFTSRNRSVLNVDRKIFTVDKLNEEEAWFVFKEKAAGACVDDSSLLSIAREVARECNGLPLALVTVARAVRGNLNEPFSVADIPVWKDALMQLRKGNPTAMPLVIDEVYNPIKLSYDFLKNKQAESLLFLCSFFPEDYDISVEEDLLYYSFGLRMFDGINNLEETRNRIAMLVGTLKGRFLILDGEEEHYVKMHDVVRDVINYIASEEKHAILHLSSMDCWSRRYPHSDCCTMLSVVPKERITKVPMELSFPALRFLWMHSSRFENLQLSDDFFKGMQQIEVLRMEFSSFASTLPQTMQLLKNLHTLHLSNCSFETLSAVGELSNLEILICQTCWSITELPIEIGRLNRLMVLDVSGCPNVKTIRPGVISKLVQLEELKMLSSFRGWESNEKGNNKSNVSLTELESLDNLKCLEIEIEDWRLAAEELQLSSKIVKYKIIVGNGAGPSDNEKSLILHFPMKENVLSLGNWIYTFARTAEYLWLEGGAFGSDKNDMNSSSSSSAAYHHSLNQFLFGSTEDIPHPNFFAGLQTLRIFECGNIYNLFSYSIAGNLVNLKRLNISRCNEMVYVIDDDITNTETTSEANPQILFRKLEEVLLRSLPKLQSFSTGKCDLQFPSLINVDIRECPRMEGFTMGSLSTPKMKIFMVDREEKNVEELNKYPWQL